MVNNESVVRYAAHLLGIGANANQVKEVLYSKLPSLSRGELHSIIAIATELHREVVNAINSK